MNTIKLETNQYKNLKDAICCITSSTSKSAKSNEDLLKDIVKQLEEVNKHLEDTSTDHEYLGIFCTPINGQVLIEIENGVKAYTNFPDGTPFTGDTTTLGSCPDNPTDKDVSVVDFCVDGNQFSATLVFDHGNNSEMYFNWKDAQGNAVATDPRAGAAVVSSGSCTTIETDLIRTNWLPMCVDGVQWYAAEVSTYNNSTNVESAPIKVYKQGANGVFTLTAPVGNVVEGQCTSTVVFEPACLTQNGISRQVELEKTRNPDSTISIRVLEVTGALITTTTADGISLGDCSQGSCETCD